ncbi:spore germination protein [Irregularibacter muris]|uniref:Spore germination protein n=1 Tax=Irregularibacter muris TaxID=1796619 RepID=A0AAE3HJ23_9FIRM|nr:spore germination protein [Irregularibacter muris]MCR1899764.1 spore germination protein [Irregularibacter muris]
MEFWKKLKNKFIESNMSDKREKDIIFPESKGKITINILKEKLADIEDLIIKDIIVGGEKVSLLFMKSLIERLVLQDMILTPLENIKGEIQEDTFKMAVKVEDNQLPELLYDIASGSTILIAHRKNLILKLDTTSPPNRSISSPLNETTVMGPSDSFTEDLDMNIGLIKKRIANPELKVKGLILGTEMRNKISVLYMNNIANQENIDRVLYRLNNIEFQGFWGTSTLKQMIEDSPFSPFPQLGITVRPDTTVSALLDGRIIVLMDSSTEAIIAPMSFYEMFITPEDYYNRWISASFLRLPRFGGFFITIMLTPFYISILTYHPEMLPPPVLALLFESRMRVPFPPLVEVIIIEIVIEVLREAGARMPSKIGQTIGIVGGIVIGTAAVDAGLASNILIVLVALSALLSFLSPAFLMSSSARMVRYIFIIAAGTFGLYGQMLTFAWLLAHLANLTSLGTPYLAPFIPRLWSDLLDTIFRAPMKFIYKRKGMSRAKKQLIRPLDEE